MLRAPGGWWRGLRSCSSLPRALRVCEALRAPEPVEQVKVQVCGGEVAVFLVTTVTYSLSGREGAWAVLATLVLQGDEIEPLQSVFVGLQIPFTVCRARFRCVNSVCHC